ncbi:hypothetical protein C0J52_18682 [Blattella germanica]|nr:hypothetical protein C0J52_18682 [Blattella germanica]
MSEYEPPRAVLQQVRDSPKINVFCAVSHTKVYGPFFFSEQTVNGARYLDMLQIWLMPQLNEQQVNLDDLKQCIRQAMASINADYVTNVWDELDYRMDVCRVTGGAHIDHL